MPVNGKTAKGISDVTGIGTGSNIHHKAHKNVTPATIAMADEYPEKSNSAARARPSSGANHNKVDFIFCMAMERLFKLN